MTHVHNDGHLFLTLRHDVDRALAAQSESVDHERPPSALTG